jgi:hypothetical protein
VEVAAPPEAVWALRLDFVAHLPAYNPAVRDIVRVAEGRGAGGALGPGAAYAFQLDTPAGPHPVTMVVTAAEENRLIDADMQGAVGANERFTVEPLEGGGTRAAITLWVEVPPGVTGPDRDRVLAGGRHQIRAELQKMALLLAPGTA